MAATISPAGTAGRPATAFNGDGKLDVAATSNDVDSVLLGTGTGTFMPKVDYPSGGTAMHIAIGDLDVDGKADITTKREFGAGADPVGIVIADFDKDGHPDLGVANQRSDSVSVLQQACVQ